MATTNIGAVSLSDFAAELRASMPTQRGLRPFVCHGDPRQATVLIVGFNPATVMREDWWSFWSDQTGFDYARWREAYQAEREARVRAAGGERRQRVSATRRVLEALVARIGAGRVVEANLFAVPTRTAAEVDSRYESQEHFRCLLRRLRPRVVLAYGKPAHAAARRLIDELVSTNELRWPAYIEQPHFSRPSGGRGWGSDRIGELARQVLEADERAVATQ